MLLSSMVQTRSMELVLAPIAAQVSELRALTEARGSTPLPELMSPAISVLDAVQNLANVGQRLATGSSDEELQAAMPVACTQALFSAQSLLEAAGQLCDDPVSFDGQTQLLAASQGVLEGTMKVLLVWDDAEVRNIVRTASWVQDRLQVVRVARSMRALVISFGGLSEALMQLINLADKRQKDLTQLKRRQRILSALDQIKSAIPKLSQAMQFYVKNPHHQQAKETRDTLSEEISSAVQDLVDAVSCFLEEEGEHENMAENIIEVHRKLAVDGRYSIGPDLDRNIDAIVKNSMAVAHVSRDQYRKVILGLCNEVMTLRAALGDHLAAVHENPDSEETKATFDHTAEQMCKKLCELDRWVADSVVDQVTDAFVNTSAPLDHLVMAATATATATPTPPSTTSPSGMSQASESESTTGLTRQVELFRRHSQRLSEVATYAAQSSADSERVQLIQKLAEEVDQLTPQVVKAAMRAKKEPENRVARQNLNSLRAKWSGKVQQLTGAIDDIINPGDFTAVSVDNIREDMIKCREAIQGENWAELATVVRRIAAKARRVIEVARTQVDTVPKRHKKSLEAAMERTERAIPTMVTLANELITNPTSKSSHDQFVLSLRELLKSLHEIQDLLEDKEEEDEWNMDENLSYGLYGRPREPPLPPSTSTPVSTTTKPPQVKKRLLGAPTYIGSLGASKQWGKGGAVGRVKKPRVPTPPSSRTKGVPFDEPDDRSHPSWRESFSEGFSGSMSLGDVETQTPSKRTRDQSSQADMRYPSATFGSVPSTVVSPSSSHGSSWTAGNHKLEPDSPTRKTVQSYATPLQRLADAAKAGDAAQTDSQAVQLAARSIRLTGIAESAASTLRQDTELQKVLEVKASEVHKLTPEVIQQARAAAKHPDQGRKVEELEMTMHRWAGNVRQLVDATQQANLPWSRTMDKLVTAAKTGEGLEKQIRHVYTQTERLVDVATTTIAAAEAEESLGSTAESESDQEFEDEVKRVKVTISEIKKLVPELVHTAQMAVNQAEGSATVEHLNVLAHEIATKVNVGLKEVDNLTLGMGGAADTLLVAARSGDAGLLAEQTQAIQSLASSLQSIAKDAVAGCEDERKEEVVLKTAENLHKLAGQLTECAEELSKEQAEAEKHVADENASLLRREWASQVHLLMANVDHLTADVAAPLDRLVDLALQASRTTSLAQQHLLTMFESKASFIVDQLNLVDQLFEQATQDLPVEREQAVNDAAASIAFLKKLTPHVIGAARSLATDPGSAMLDHFSHLRRQWAAKAQFLQAQLRSITSADMDEVLAVFEELIRRSKPSPDTSALGADQEQPSSPIPRFYSAENLEDESLEYDYIELKKPSTPKPPSKKYMNLVEPEQATLVLKPPHRTKRPVSMHLPLPSWVTGDGEEDGFSGSSQFYAVAAAAESLRQVADKFVEEGNPIIAVANKMSQQMYHMAEFPRGRGELQSKEDMILTAKAIAANGQVIVRFANVLSEQCSDRRIKANLQYCAEMIPTLSTQLRIIASVKAATPDDASADVMLVKNAQNLMQAVIKTVQAAEAACMRGLKPLTEYEDEQLETAALALSWKKKLYQQRTLEAISAPLGERGLRKLRGNRISTPSLADYLQRDHRTSPKADSGDEGK